MIGSKEGIGCNQAHRNIYTDYKCDDAYLKQMIACCSTDFLLAYMQTKSEICCHAPHDDIDETKYENNQNYGVVEEAVVRIGMEARKGFRG